MSRHSEWQLDCKVYIGDLSHGTAKHELEDAFCKYGPLRNVWVARNPPGFAFVEFEDPRDAEDAVRAMDGQRINGRRVRVEMSHGKSRRSRRPPPPPRYSGGSYGGSGVSRSRRRSSRSMSPMRQRRRSYSRSRSRSGSRDRYRRRSRSGSIERRDSPTGRDWEVFSQEKTIYNVSNGVAELTGDYGKKFILKCSSNNCLAHIYKGSW